MIFLSQFDPALFELTLVDLPPFGVSSDPVLWARVVVAPLATQIAPLLVQLETPMEAFAVCFALVGALVYGIHAVQVVFVITVKPNALHPVVLLTLQCDVVMQMFFVQLIHSQVPILRPC